VRNPTPANTKRAERAQAPQSRDGAPFMACAGAERARLLALRGDAPERRLPWIFRGVVTRGARAAHRGWRRLAVGSREHRRRGSDGGRHGAARRRSRRRRFWSRQATSRPGRAAASRGLELNRGLANVGPHQTLTVECATLPDRLRVTVTDPGSRLEPHLQSPDHVASGGYGLRIVESLTSAWGVVRGPAGRTSVWCELPFDTLAPHQPTGQHDDTA
jgi:hypothetical protein